MGFLNVLTLIFVALKLTQYIDWNWFLVLLPTIIHCILFTIASYLIVYKPWLFRGK